MIICIKNIIQNAFKYADTKKGFLIFVSLSENVYKIELQETIKNKITQ